MTQVATVTEFACPGCATPLSSPEQGPSVCPTCRWKGEVYRFSPLAVQINAAESALPDEATCMHHPSKKATTVCAGTGDYICSLCAIEVEGQTYSAQYIDSGGKKNLNAAFAQTLPRPDRRINIYLAMAIVVPYINIVMIALGFLWIPHGFILHRRARQMRRENPLFKRVMATSTLIIQPIVLALAGIGWIVMVVAIVFALLGKGCPWR